MNYDVEGIAFTLFAYNGPSQSQVEEALSRAYAAGLEAGKAEARHGVPKTVDGMVARLAAWCPVVEAACAQLAACESVAREYRNERHAETWREATVATENAVRALAPEHRPGPAAGGGR